MGNVFKNWWRSRRFRKALKRGNLESAETIFQDIEASHTPLSLLEQTFRRKLQTEQDLKSRVHENVTLRNKLQKQLQKIETLQEQVEGQTLEAQRVSPSPEFVDFVRHHFKLTQSDPFKLQCTGIEPHIFDDFEHRLAVFLRKELKKQDFQRVKSDLQAALQDLEDFGEDREPSYGLRLSSHAYLMQGFLDNVYCSYLAWFLIYEAGLISENLRILDIGAGPGTLAYGLMLFLRSSASLSPLPPLHISYYSLDKQALMQFRGLQFWRQYIEQQQPAINIYFRFDTSDIFDYFSQDSRLPDTFFDFVVIANNFFFDPEKRLVSYNIYKSILREKLSPHGYVLLIVQEEQLFQMYEVYPTEDTLQEQNIIQLFLEELGLQLEWYKYLTSTGERSPTAEEMRQSIDENLPEQKYLSPLKKQYLEQQMNSRYFIDDYVILAKRSEEEP